MMTHGFIKGMATGALFGMGVMMAVNPITEKDRKRIAKSTSRMFTTIGSVADNIVDMYKH